jgi:aminopeptidase YwaD
MKRNVFLYFLAACLIASAFLSSCDSPAATILGESQSAHIASLAKAVDSKAVYAELGSYFSTPREPYEHLAGLERARDHICAEFEAAGCSVARAPVTTDSLVYINPDHSYVYLKGSFSMDNIIATKAGRDASLSPVLVCAHYDTVNVAPGVNDNGSGCVAVLEIARRLAGTTFDRTIVFALFAFEESGLLGSKAYVDSLTQAALPCDVICFETIGFTSASESQIAGSQYLLDLPTSGDFLGAFGSWESRSLVLDFANAAREFAPELKTYACSLDSNLGSDAFLASSMRSDHSPFWTRGVPALMLTDTADMRAGNVYHTADDDLAHIDLAFLSSGIRAGLATICAKAGI